MLSLIIYRASAGAAGATARAGAATDAGPAPVHRAPRRQSRLPITGRQGKSGQGARRPSPFIYIRPHYPPAVKEIDSGEQWPSPPGGRGAAAGPIYLCLRVKSRERGGDTRQLKRYHIDEPPPWAIHQSRVIILNAHRHHLLPLTQALKSRSCKLTATPALPKKQCQSACQRLNQQPVTLTTVRLFI